MDKEKQIGRPIFFKRIEERIQELKQRPIDSLNTGFDAEFKKLEEQTEKFLGDLDYSTALDTGNKSKNRYSNVLPNEKTRVKIYEGEDHSDYINANWIGGQLEGTEKTYIATQGPLCSTFDDFWKMVWEYHSVVIVMLTKEFENGRLKCEKYWPESEPIELNKFLISLENEEIRDDGELIIRTLKLKEMESSEERIVTQFQYTAWPDHGLPASTRAFLDLLDAVDKTSTNGPFVVHCSAGIGRSGVFCAVHSTLKKLQYDLDHGNNNPEFNMEKIIFNMRQMRQGMVQTKDQYEFCYRAIAEGARKIMSPQSDLSQSLNFGVESKPFRSNDNREDSGNEDESNTKPQDDIRSSGEYSNSFSSQDESTTVKFQYENDNKENTSHNSFDTLTPQSNNQKAEITREHSICSSSLPSQNMQADDTFSHQQELKPKISEKSDDLTANSNPSRKLFQSQNPLTDSQLDFQSSFTDKDLSEPTNSTKHSQAQTSGQKEEEKLKCSEPKHDDLATSSNTLKTLFQSQTISTDKVTDQKEETNNDSRERVNSIKLHQAQTGGQKEEEKLKFSEPKHDDLAISSNTLKTLFQSQTISTDKVNDQKEEINNNDSRERINSIKLHQAQTSGQKEEEKLKCSEPKHDDLAISSNTLKTLFQSQTISTDKVNDQKEETNNNDSRERVNSIKLSQPQPSGQKEEEKLKSSEPKHDNVATSSNTLESLAQSQNTQLQDKYFASETIKQNNPLIQSQADSLSFSNSESESIRSLNSSTSSRLSRSTSLPVSPSLRNIEDD